MPSDETIRAVAGEIARLVANGDLDGLREVFTPDARIWHNTDDEERSVEENMQFLDVLMGVTSKVWYEDVRLTPTPDGYVDQHYVCAVLNNGEELRAPMCMVVTLEGERVKRLDEYFVTEPSGPVLTTG